MLLLLVAEVLNEDVVADYELSNRYMAERNPRYCTLSVLERRDTTERDALTAVLASLDADTYLRSAGVTASDIGAVRKRILYG